MTARSPSCPGLVRITSFADLEPDVPTAFTVGDQEVLVVRTGEEVHAIGNVCTHADAYLDMGEYHVDTHEIECPLHVGRFDVRTGRATVEPCVFPVPRFRVVVDPAGVFIESPAAPP